MLALARSYISFAIQAYDESAIQVASDYYVARQRETGVVEISIRGTTTKTQHVLNFARPAAFFGAMVADYFSPQAQLSSKLPFVDQMDRTANSLISNSILEDVYRTFPDAKEFALCGHSRGGLLAIYASLSLIRSKKVVHELVTYGSPRFYIPADGSSESAPTSEELAVLNSILYRVEHSRDYVPNSNHLFESSVAGRDRFLEGTVLSLSHDTDDPHSKFSYQAGLEALLLTENREISSSGADAGNDSCGAAVDSCISDLQK